MAVSVGIRHVPAQVMTTMFRWQVGQWAAVVLVVTEEACRKRVHRKKTMSLEKKDISEKQCNNWPLNYVLALDTL